MDLDKYKKAWENQPEETHKVSKVDIYKMAYSKSSSIVKWIFIIGILEFAFVTIINFTFRINPDEYNHLDNFIFRNYIWLEVISYTIMIYFLVKFYINYKSISTSDNTKTLMNKIIKTRKTVKAYVFVNLSFLFIVSIVVICFTLFNENTNEHGFWFYFTTILVTIIILGIFVGLYWLFYQLLYGILLRKLNKNYKELAKLDELN